MNTKEQDHDAFYKEAFSRNIGILTEKEQAKIRETHIAIAGLGGVGGMYAISFARLGVEHFSISDKDTFETANINRQAGAMQSTFGKDKTAVVAQMILDINPYAEIRQFPNGISENTVDDFIKEASIVIDGLDFFAPKVRRLLFHKAQEKNIFAITAGPIGFGSSILIFDPQGMTYDSYFNLSSELDDSELILRFGLGIAPALLQRSYFKPEKVNLGDRSAPSVDAGVLMASSLILCETTKIILGKKVSAVPASYHFDPFTGHFKKTYLLGGNRNPLQMFKRWYVKKLIQKQ